MPLDPRRVKELFVAAVELPVDPARQAFLDRECGDDAELRQRLDVLLAAHDAPHPAVNQPLAAEMPGATAAYESLTAPAEAVGSVIAGKYRCPGRKRLRASSRCSNSWGSNRAN
jgi:hypothetical protein